MKKLILIRHGKSSWDFPLPDHDRPLQERGVMDAHNISEELHKILKEKFIIYSSSARRAFDTAKIVAQNLSISEDLIVKSRKLYVFDYKLLKDFIDTLDDKFNSVILFCHNNAITDFVNKFGDTFFENIPTAGVVILDFKQDHWNSIQDGKVTKTIFPKELRNES